MGPTVERSRASSPPATGDDIAADAAGDATLSTVDASELLERVFATTELQIAYLDRDFRFLRVNRAYAQAAEGRSPDFFVGRSHFDLYPNPDNEAIFRRVLETGEPHVASGRPFEYARHPERGITYWDWTLQSVRDAAGAIVGLLLTLADVTARERSLAALRARERELVQSEAYARALIEASVDGLLTVDPELRIRDVNRQMCTLAGEAREQLVGTRFSDHFAESVAAAAAVERALRQGVVTDCALTLRAADGRETPVSINAANFTDPRGETQGLLASVRDLTVSRELERQQREAQKMEAIGRLAGGVGHEFKNLLTVVNVYAGLLEAAIPVEDPRHASVEEILGAGERATALLRQLLTLGRREVGEPVLVDAADLLAQLAPMLQRLAGPTADLQAHAESGLGAVRCDPAQLEEMLVNLVTNACDAMSTGGVLTIELRPLEVGDATTAVPAALPRGRYVRLDVTDTGVGMDAATLERIFEPFFTTKPVGRGTGLGLATVYGTVRQLGGAIAVRSQPGQGTRFTICLPVAADLEAGAPTA